METSWSFFVEGSNILWISAQLSTSKQVELHKIKRKMSLHVVIPNLLNSQRNKLTQNHSAPEWKHWI